MSISNRALHLQRTHTHNSISMRFGHFIFSYFFTISMGSVWCSSLLLFFACVLYDFVCLNFHLTHSLILLGERLLVTLLWSSVAHTAFLSSVSSHNHFPNEYFNLELNCFFYSLARCICASASYKFADAFHHTILSCSFIPVLQNAYRF